MLFRSALQCQYERINKDVRHLRLLLSTTSVRLQVSRYTCIKEELWLTSLAPLSLVGKANSELGWYPFVKERLTISLSLLALFARPGWGSWTLVGSVALLLAEVASAREGTGDLLIGAVADLTAVEAFPPWLW